MRTFSIYRGLVVSVLALVLLLGGSLFIANVLGARTAVATLSAAVIRQAVREVEAELRQFFGVATRGLEMARAWGRQGLLDIEDAAALNALFVPFVEVNAQVSSLLLADERGREHMILRTANKWLNRQTRPGEWGTQSRWLEWSDASPEPTASWKDLGYDPRNRPWYQLAAAQPGSVPVRWTTPYQFFTTKEPGITAASAFTGPNGLLHVLGFDFLLKDISEFTMALPVLRRGRAFVLTEDERVIGLPYSDRFADREARQAALLQAARRIGVALVADALAALEAGPADGEPTRFRSEGERWWGTQSVFGLGPEQSLSIVVVVPESDVLGQLSRLKWSILLMTALFVVLGAGLTAWLSRYYSQPIEALVQESERIGHGDLEAPARIRTRLREVLRLAAAHERMRAGLRQLMKLNRELKLARQIQQKTFPERLPSLADFAFEAWSVPAEETGGDSYDLVGVGGKGMTSILAWHESADHAILMLADATGHGMGPALSVTQVRAMLRMGIRAGLTMPAIVEQMNEQLCADLTAGRFITAWFGRLDASDKTLLSFSAGQGPLLHLEGRSGEVRVLNADTPPLGILEDIDTSSGVHIALEPGDLFVVLSDGIFEATAPDRTHFGIERVRELLQAHQHQSAHEILAALRRAVDQFTAGARADDDRTAILIKRLAGG